MPKRFTAATVITMALALGACGGGSDAAKPTDPPPASGVNTTAATDPDPTQPPLTASTTTTSSTTEPPTTSTEPAPTTTEPSVEVQVTEASFRLYDLYWSCLRMPGDCSVSSGYLPESDAFRALTNTVNDLAAAGLYVGEEDVGYQVIESIEIKDDHTAVTSCWWATGVLYLLPPIEGAEPTIQNDRRETARQVDQFVQDAADGAWKIRRSDQIELVAGENTCPPER